MSEAWVSTELLYNSTPIGSERKRQLNPLLGGRELVRCGQHAEMRIQAEEACIANKTKKKKKKIGPSLKTWRGSALKYKPGNLIII